MKLNWWAEKQTKDNTGRKGGQPIMNKEKITYNTEDITYIVLYIFNQPYDISINNYPVYQMSKIEQRPDNLLL